VGLRCAWRAGYLIAEKFGEGSWFLGGRATELTHHGLVLLLPTEATLPRGSLERMVDPPSASELPLRYRDSNTPLCSFSEVN
jgi:hypothetical protein